MTSYDFSDLTVLITGAGAGFGLAAARAFLSAGANLVLSDYSEKTLNPAQSEFGDNDRVALLAGDVSIPSTHENLVDLAIQRFGRLDVACNNAGIAHLQKRLEEITDEEAQSVMTVDALGVFYAMRAQIPVMRKQYEESGKGGAILNTASVAGLVGAPTMSVYAAAKHAVVGLTKSAAIENARKGIRINALCPAFARTNMVEAPLNMSPKGRDVAEARLIANIPMQRIGEVDEVVQAMLWACDSANSFYTGQALAIDGGLQAG